MKTLQKFGGIAALYMAISHLIGIVIFIVILDFSASPTRLKSSP